MQTVLVFLGNNEPLIYLTLLLLGLLFPFRWVWKAWREWREAYFGLEREIAMRRLAQAVSAVFLILVLMCVEFSIATFLLPGLPASALIGTPTVDLLAGASPNGSAEQTAMLALTPGAAAPTPGSNGCVPGKLEITFPKPGDNLSGSVTILGTANVPGLAFYKYEFTLQGSEIWATVSAKSEAVTNGELGAWNTSALIPGDYLLRLVVTDTQGNVLPPCIVPIRIIGQ